MGKFDIFNGNKIKMSVEKKPKVEKLKSELMHNLFFPDDVEQQQLRIPGYKIISTKQVVRREISVHLNKNNLLKNGDQVITHVSASGYPSPGHDRTYIVDHIDIDGRYIHVDLVRSR